MRIGDFEIEPDTIGWRVWRHSECVKTGETKGRPRNIRYYHRFDHIAASMADEVARELVPAHEAVADLTAQLRDVTRGDFEGAPDGRRVEQVEHGAGPHPAADEVEQAEDDDLMTSRKPVPYSRAGSIVVPSHHSLNEVIRIIFGSVRPAMDEAASSIVAKSAGVPGSGL